MPGLWRLLPIGRATAGLWAWKNRRELGRWLGFVWRAFPLRGNRDDVLAEGRLRAALAKDARTRGIPALSVRVANGTAFLDGHLLPDVHDLVFSIAQRSKGVRDVDAGSGDRGSRRTPMSHMHTIPVAAIPPRPV